jgi:hypothetical protein
MKDPFTFKECTKEQVAYSIWCEWYAAALERGISNSAIEHIYEEWKKGNLALLIEK